MSSDQLKPIIRQATPSEESWYIHPRRSVHIAEGDWKRWMRTISRIPNREHVFRAVGFTLAGIAASSLLTFVALGFSTKWAADWPLFIYLVVGISSSLGGAATLYFDSRMQQVTQTRVEDVLLDMKEVRERATISEEKPSVSKPVTQIG